MKVLLTISTLFIMSHFASAQAGQATSVRKTFSRTTSVYIDIQASPSIVWSLLTNASDFARWNSTIISMEGSIKAGQKIKFRSTVDPGRSFKLKVKLLRPDEEMIWSDGVAPFFKGVRIYTLTSNADGSLRFSMSEKLSGLMFPLAAKSIPSFDESFEQFAADLKKEAEIIQRGE